MELEKTNKLTEKLNTLNLSQSDLQLLNIIYLEKNNPEQLGKDLIALAHFVKAEGSQPLSQAEIAKLMNESAMTTCRRFKRWRKRGLNI
jgi:hypothetical protein